MGHVLSLAEKPTSGIRYLCLHCNISVFMQMEDAKDAMVPVRGFLISAFSHEQVESMAVKPLRMAPDALRNQ